MSQTGKVVAAFFGVFVAGAIFGGAIAFRVVQPAAVSSAPLASAVPAGENPPPANPAPVSRPPAPLPPAQVQPALMRQFTQRLKLTPEQREKIKPVVSHATEELARLRRENLQETSRVTETMYAEVAASLTPAQVAELDKMKHKMQERVAEERKKRGGEPAAEPARKGAGRIGAQ